MAWIESHQSLKDHPKTLMLSALMEWDIDLTIGKLHRFWWWCLDYAPDGDLSRFNDTQIALGAGVAVLSSERFVKAMKQSCWIDSEPYFRVHDWWDYCGRYLKIKWKNYPAKWEYVMKQYLGNPIGDPKTLPKPPNQPTNQPTGGAGSPLGTPDDEPGKIRALDLTKLSPNNRGDHFLVEKRLELITKRIAHIRASREKSNSPMRDAQNNLVPEWQKHIEELKAEEKRLADWLTGCPSPT